MGRKLCEASLEVERFGRTSDLSVGALVAPQQPKAVHPALVAMAPPPAAGYPRPQFLAPPAAGSRGRERCRLMSKDARASNR